MFAQSNGARILIPDRTPTACLPEGDLRPNWALRVPVIREALLPPFVLFIGGVIVSWIILGFRRVERAERHRF